MLVNTKIVATDFALIHSLSYNFSMILLCELCHSLSLLHKLTSLDFYSPISEKFRR